LNIVSDISCLVIASVSWIFATIQHSTDTSVTNFYIFYDVSAVINIGFYAFVFILLGPLNTQVQEIVIAPGEEPHMPLEEEEEEEGGEESVSAH
jgi:hypothetical protein